MNFRRILAAAIAAVALVAGNCVVAGEIKPLVKSVEFVDGKREFVAGELVRLQFFASEYSYGAGEYGYGLFALVPSDAYNPGNSTVRAIEDAALYGAAFRAGNQALDLTSASAPFRAAFPAPKHAGSYTLLANEVPMFRQAPFETGSAGLKTLFKPTRAQRAELLYAANSRGNAWTEVTRIRVIEQRAATRQPPPIYLKVNNAIPGTTELIGGTEAPPLRFQWYVGPEYKGDPGKVLFRYQMGPEDDKTWGAWTTAREVYYHFLLKGVHQFRVQAKLVDEKDDVDAAPASFLFVLDRDLIARPSRSTLKSEVVSKQPTNVIPSIQAPIVFKEVYASSRALVVGIWDFDDFKSFPKFEGAKIRADVAAMDAALKVNGFTVHKLSTSTGRVTREQILDALTSLVSETGENDRLFIYFSTHGFPDPEDSGEGYLATSDCFQSKPLARCIKLSELEEHAKRALNRKARQVLFAVDSCFSGLGIVRKNASTVPDLSRIAVPQGVFMLTAGMATQVAQIDPSLSMSTFTYYLSEGLRGKADIMRQGGVITLSELYLYVQYEVARKTGSKQIPMLGRMRGEGEMIFQPQTN
jgi:hypothetical protein